jgi:toxin ParE1/3/4
MTAYRLSPRAQDDLDEIWDYSEAQWGTDQAETYARQLQRAFETLAIHPTRGRSCDRIRKGYFRLSAGSHVIFYRMAGDAVDIVRILHQRMDFERHL